MEQSLIEQFADAIKQEPNDKQTTYSAIVSRIDEEGTIWVYVAGSDKDTPTAQTGVEVKKGDSVTVEWRNNKLFIAGNYSNPSAGINRVQDVEVAAKVAKESAESAVYDAGRAKDAAEDAIETANSVRGIAQTAQNYAESAKDSAQNASAMANAAGIAASVAQAAAEAAQGDIDEQKEWFWHDATGTHVLGNERGYRNDIDSAGMKIVDTLTQEPVTKFAVNDVRVGRESENNIHITNNRFEMINEGTAVAYLEGERLKSGDAEITNLYMKTHGTDGSEIGALGFVMRSNGHLSIRRLK